MNTKSSKTEQTIPIETVVIRDRTRKDFGDISILAESISSVGLLQPIVINENKELVDGQRRILAYKQLGKKEIQYYQVSLEQIIIGEFHANSNHKDFTSSERVAISNAVEKHIREHSRGIGRPKIDQKTDRLITIGSEQSSNSTNPVIDKDYVVNLTTYSGRIKDNVSKYLGTTRNTLEKEKRIVEAAERDPQSFEDTRQKVDNRKISVDKGFKIIQKKIKRDQVIAAARESTDNSKIETLFLGDFREESKKIPYYSVDLIFTDPLYYAKEILLYKDLAAVAFRVLKDGGSLVAYANHCLIPEITKFMEDTGLNRQWILAIKLSGPFSHFHPKKVSIKWKPLLWFIKGNKINSIDYISDFIESKRVEKISNEYEQSLVEAQHVISRLTVEGQKVFDPMMGSGTTGVATIKLDRKFIGIEIDSVEYEKARMRITRVR